LGFYNFATSLYVTLSLYVLKMHLAQKGKVEQHLYPGTYNASPDVAMAGPPWLVKGRMSLSVLSL